MRGQKIRRLRLPPPLLQLLPHLPTEKWGKSLFPSKGDAPESASLFFERDLKEGA